MCGVCGTNDSRHGESVLARADDATNSGGRTPGSKLPASSPPLPRPDGGGTPGRVPVYTAKKSQPINRRTAPVELHNRDIDHLCSSTTATIALQLELKVVVVVGANNVNAAEPAIQHAKTPNVFLVLVISSRVVVVVWANFVIAADPEIQHAYTTNDLLVLEILMRYFPVIGLKLSQTES